MSEQCNEMLQRCVCGAYIYKQKEHTKVLLLIISHFYFMNIITPVSFPFMCTYMSNKNLHFIVDVYIFIFFCILSAMSWFLMTVMC